MPISPTDLGKLRGTSQLARPIVNVIPPRTVATAQINQDEFSAALGELTVDNTSADWTDIEVGQMVWIGRTAGAYDVLVATVRKSPTSTKLYIDGISPGASGTARRINYALREDQYITVVDFYPIWSQLSRIYRRTFYKQFDIAYDGSGSNPNPVANLGAWQRIDADLDTGTGTFTLDASNSVAWGSKTISTYLWVLPTGVSLVSGSLTDSSITVSASPGWYHVSCTVTDSSAATHTGWTVLCCNGTGFSPLSDTYACLVENDHQDLKGREMTLRVYGDVPDTVFFPGSAVLYDEEQLFNGTTVSDGVVVETFVGYMVNEPVSGSYKGKSLSVTLRSPYLLLNDVPMVSQAITEKSSPSRWDHIGTGYGTPDVVLWYVLHHHCPNILKWFDFHPLPEASPPRKKRWGLNGSNIQEYCNQVSEAVGGNIGSASDGSLFFFRDPTLEDINFRTAMDSRLTYDENDILGELVYGLDYRLKTGQFTAYAFAYTGGNPVPLGSIAPGIIQSQGIGREEIQSFIVADQAELNTKSAQLFQRANSDIPQLSWVANRNFDVADPARHYNTWFYFDFDSSINPRGVDVEGRGVIESVDRSWSETDKGGLVKQVNHGLRPETYNETPGQTIPIQRGTGNLYDPDYETNPPEDYNPLIRFMGFGAAFNDEGKLARTFNLLDPNGANWQDITPAAMTGKVNELCLDWWSELPQSGWKEGAMGGYMVSTSSTTLSIWYIDDLLANEVTWTLLDTYTMNDDNVEYTARVQVSKSEADFVAIAWHDYTGTYVGRSTDSGITWGTAVQVGDTVEDFGNENVELGFAIDGTNQLISGPDSDMEYGLYLATTTGGAFSEVTSTPRTGVPSAMIQVNSTGDVYFVSDYKSLLVTFDPGGYTDYDFPFSFSGQVNEVRTDGQGNPDNYAILKENTTITGVQTYVAWRIKGFPSGAYIHWVSFDLKFNTFDPPASECVGANPGTNCNWISGAPSQFRVSLTGFDLTTCGSTDIDIHGEFPEYIYNSNTYYRMADWTRITKLVNCYLSTTAMRYEMWNSQVYLGNGPPMYIDNFFVKYSSPGKLYHVADYASSPAWTDITPSVDNRPTGPFGLAVDLAVETTLDCMGTDDVPITNWYQSVNEGTAWTDQGSTSYRGAKRAGNNIILFGDGTIAFSDDGGLTTVETLGDWATTIGTVGLIRGVVTIV